jgi:hypothetical protein
MSDDTLAQPLQADRRQRIAAGTGERDRRALHLVLARRAARRAERAALQARLVLARSL